MNDHVVITGAGTVARQVVQELLRTGRAKFVLIDRDPERIEHLRETCRADVPALVGDALDEDLLEEAGIRTAFGLISTRRHDRDNLFLVITVRQMNPDLRIVSRVDELANEVKLRKVGANGVVSTALFGGRRLAHAIVRPQLAALSDALAHAEENALQLLEIDVGSRSEVANLRLSTACLPDRTGCVIVGHRTRPRQDYAFRPEPRTRLVAGSTVVALGDRRQLDALRALLAPTD